MPTYFFEGVLMIINRLITVSVMLCVAPSLLAASTWTPEDGTAFRAKCRSNPHHSAFYGIYVVRIEPKLYTSKVDGEVDSVELHYRFDGHKVYAQCKGRSVQAPSQSFYLIDRTPPKDMTLVTGPVLGYLKEAIVRGGFIDGTTTSEDVVFIDGQTNRVIGMLTGFGEDIGVAKPRGARLSFDLYTARHLPSCLPSVTPEKDDDGMLHLTQVSEGHPLATRGAITLSAGNPQRTQSLLPYFGDLLHMVVTEVRGFWNGPVCIDVRPCLDALAYATFSGFVANITAGQLNCGTPSAMLGIE